MTRPAPRTTNQKPETNSARLIRRELLSLCRAHIEKRFDHIERDRKDYRGVLFDPDLGERLKIPQLDSDRLDRDHARRSEQPLRRLILAFRVNDLRPLF